MRKSRRALTDQQGRLPIVVHERSEHQEQRVLGGQVFQVVGAVVVHHDLPELPFPKQLLALAGGREVGEGGLTQLQPASIEPIRAVDVDGTADVIDVVQYERSAVEDHRSDGGRSLGQGETLGQIAGSDDTGFT